MARAPKKKVTAKKAGAKPARRPVKKAEPRPRSAGKPRPPSAAKRKPANAAKGEPRKAPSVLPIEIEPGGIEKALRQIREELGHWVKKGRYTKVRFKLRGKPLLPDLPVSAVLAAEALSFWWAGLLRMLLVNVGAKALLDVELVSDADLEVGRGQAALLAGDLERAMESFDKALAMDRDCAAAHLNLGIAHKLRGERAAARLCLEKAEQLDPTGPHGEEARRLLDQLSPGQAGPATEEQRSP